MIAVLAVAIVAGQSDASQATIPMMERATAHAVLMPVCANLGYRTASDFPLTSQTRVVDAAIAQGATQEFALRWLRESAPRSARLITADFERAVASLEDGADAKATLEAALVRIGEACDEAASNPVIGDLIERPADPHAARIAFQDDLLAGYGQASWQTRSIWNRGELAFALGACRHRVSGARHDQIEALYLSAGDPDRAVSWYRRQYAEGLGQAVTMDLDETQCGRLLTSRTAAAR